MAHATQGGLTPAWQPPEAPRVDPAPPVPALYFFQRYTTMPRFERARNLAKRSVRGVLGATLPWIHATPAARWAHARLKAVMPDTWERVRLRVFPLPPPPAPEAPAAPPPPPVRLVGPAAWEPAQTQLTAALLTAAGYSAAPTTTQATLEAHASAATPAVAP